MRALWVRFIGFCLAFAFFCSAQEEEILEEIPIYLNWPLLPTWTPEELEAIDQGELVLGTDLFRPLTGEVSYADLFEPLPELEIIEEEAVVQEEDSPYIAEEFLSSYFGSRPARYLVDPQGMLSMQEMEDRQKFLEFHAGDSKIDLYIYLFDAEQELPTEGDIKTVFSRHFSRGNGLTALVYYFLGAPERSLLVLSPEINSVVPVNDVRSALIDARQQAQTKSEVASQLESFSNALSIRLYWMERSLAESEELLAYEPLGGDLTVIEAENRLVRKTEASTPEMLIVMSAGGVLCFGAIVFLWYRFQKKKQCFFPEVEVRPLLGAPHAAGIGAVIQFDSTALPPSSQREKVPDYLKLR